MSLLNLLRLGPVALALLLLGSAGCDPGPGRDESAATNPDGVNLLLTSAAGGAEPIVRIHFVRDAQRPGPRVIELKLDHSDNLTFVGASAGAALLAAGKQLVAQVPAPGRLRLVALSTGSMDEVMSGDLVELRFRRSGTGTATVDFEGDGPVFAPAEANQGLRLGDPLVLAD